jgi:hypothetical protein
MRSWKRFPNVHPRRQKTLTSSSLSARGFPIRTGFARNGTLATLPRRVRSTIVVPINTTSTFVAGVAAIIVKSLMLHPTTLSPLSLRTVFSSRHFHRHLRSLLSAVSWCNASLLRRVFHLRHSRSISSSSPRGIDGYYLILLSSMVPLLKYNSCSTSLYSWCPTETPRMKLVLSAPFLPPATQSLSNALALSKARHPAPSVLKATAT